LSNQSFIEITFYLTGILSIAYLLVLAFAIGLKCTPLHIHPATDGVSVIIAAHNELENLKRFLPSILNQAYPVFEVIVACDRCTDGTVDFLASLPNGHLHYIDIKEPTAGFNSKKAALDQAIRKAQYAWILATDADCYPNSNQWITSMMQYKEQKDICLGISIYSKQNTLLNSFIRFETLFTALNYLGWAIIAKPYMGVGRNILYKKELFINNSGFGKYADHLGGDDDLLIQSISKKSNTAANISKFGITISLPAEGFKSWWKQKHRHLHAGKQYPIKVLFGLGSYPFLSTIFHLVSIYCILSLNFQYIIPFYILRTCIFISIFVWIGQKLNAGLSLLFLPIAEILYLIYLLFAGFYNLVVPIKKWK